MRTPIRTVVDGPVVVGGGLAGLLAAVRLSPVPTLVLAAGELGTGTSTSWAQGGIAAAVGPDDSPELHLQDTLAAGAGLCDPDAVCAVVEAGPAAIDELVTLGARFDRCDDGSLDLGLEGAHGRRRIVHALGDGTGAELQRVAVEAARGCASVTVREHTRALEVLTDDDGVCGLLVEGPHGLEVLVTREVVLATGGIGGLFGHTTNPLGSRGQGLALAVRAGALVRDPEMVQFHPTALDVGLDPMPLVSEAVRGEGALLVTDAGRPVLDDPLAARDVVARASWAALQRGSRVYLDARAALGPDVERHFPAITASCRAAGVDPATELVPVRPAVHYAMGGVAVDLRGRTAVAGLHAVGECASTGLHGANRLASNSLLEAVVCSRWVAQDIATTSRPASATGPVLTAQTARALARLSVPAAPIAEVRRLLDGAAGVLRDAPGLTAALARLTPLATTDDAALTAALVVRGALDRTESRGGHTRTDHPGQSMPTHTMLGLDDIVGSARCERTAS